MPAPCKWGAVLCGLSSKTRKKRELKVRNKQKKCKNPEAEANENLWHAEWLPTKSSFVSGKIRRRGGPHPLAFIKIIKFYWGVPRESPSPSSSGESSFGKGANDPC